MRSGGGSLPLPSLPTFVYWIERNEHETGAALHHSDHGADAALYPIPFEETNPGALVKLVEGGVLAKGAEWIRPGVHLLPN